MLTVSARGLGRGALYVRDVRGRPVLLGAADGETAARDRVLRDHPDAFHLVVVPPTAIWDLPVEPRIARALQRLLRRFLFPKRARPPATAPTRPIRGLDLSRTFRWLAKLDDELRREVESAMVLRLVAIGDGPQPTCVCRIPLARADATIAAIAGGKLSVARAQRRVESAQRQYSRVAECIHRVMPPRRSRVIGARGGTRDKTTRAPPGPDLGTWVIPNRPVTPIWDGTPEEGLEDLRRRIRAAEQRARKRRSHK